MAIASCFSVAFNCVDFSSKLASIRDPVTPSLVLFGFTALVEVAFRFCWSLLLDAGDVVLEYGAGLLASNRSFFCVVAGI